MTTDSRPLAAAPPPPRGQVVVVQQQVNLAVSSVAMLVRFNKQKEPTIQRAGTLVCVRDDGSQTLTPQTAFFVEHDLTHYAVETTFGIANAFLGLVASGMDVQDFNVPGAIKNLNLPLEAVQVEMIVGTLQIEKRNGALYDDFADEVRKACVQNRAVFPEWLDNARVETARRRAADLIEQFLALPPGGALELRFPAEAPLNS